MLSALIRRRARLVAGTALIVAVLLTAAVVALGGATDVVVYNGRSQYGDEAAFTAWEERTGKSLELRAGSAPELFERLRSEGGDTPADLLVTTDLANLWRAKEAGMLEPVSTPALERQVPAALRDPDERWWGLSLRIRTPMRSTERVAEDAIRTYADLGDPKFRGRLCLRTSNNEYNQSLVADQIAKRGDAATERMLRSWMANEPQILGSDVDVLEAIAAGRCDAGLTNHYYLGRILEEQPDFPVAPAWPDQDGAGAHTNLSGVGLVKGSEHRADAISLMEHLTSPAAQREIVANSELAVNASVPPPEHIRDWAEVKRDPIDVERAGELLPRAIALMQQVGWK
ncbi:MAG: extracellular solute-binding protein [Solirubrobacteraceae bacterium]